MLPFFSCLQPLPCSISFSLSNSCFLYFFIVDTFFTPKYVSTTCTMCKMQVHFLYVHDFRLTRWYGITNCKGLCQGRLLLLVSAFFSCLQFFIQGYGPVKFSYSNQLVYLYSTIISRRHSAVPLVYTLSVPPLQCSQVLCVVLQCLLGTAE